VSALDTVRRWQACMMAGDVAGARDLMDDGFTFSAPPALPFVDEAPGAEGLFATLTREHELFDMSLAAPVEYVQTDGPVLTRLAGRATAKATGRSADFAMVQLYEARDGRLARLDIYYKDPDAIAALVRPAAT
jgi:ketosteroid isomerase-like protein